MTTCSQKVKSITFLKDTTTLEENTEFLGFRINYAQYKTFISITRNNL